MERLGKEYLNPITSKPLTAQDLHVVNVYNDPEFQKEAKAAKSDEEYKDIAERYVIKITDVRHFLNGFEQTSLVRRTKIHFDLQPDFKGGWVAQISHDITKAE